VRSFEALARGGERRQAIRAGSVERRAQLIALAGVAQVELAHETRCAGSRPSVASSWRDFVSSARKIASACAGRDLVERLQVGADIVMHHVGA